MSMTKHYKGKYEPNVTDKVVGRNDAQFFLWRFVITGAAGSQACRFPYLQVNGNFNTLSMLCPLSLLHLLSITFVMNITYFCKHTVLCILVIRLHTDMSRKMSLSHVFLRYTFNSFLCTIVYSAWYDKKSENYFFAWKCIYPYTKYICKLQSSTRLCSVHAMVLLRWCSDTSWSASSH